MSNRHRPSLLGALLWTGFGILFLLRNFGIGPDFWSLAGRYWPILLILLGAGKVIDYFLRKESVAINVGEIIGIFFLLILGSTITKIHETHIGRIIRDFPITIRGAQIRPGQWLGDSYTYSEEATYPLSSSMPIRIENSYGSVSVSPGSDKEIRVRIKKEIFDKESRAKETAGEIHLQAGPERKGDPASPIKPEAEPSTKLNPDYFVVKTNRDALNLKDRQFNTHLEVIIPKNSQVQVVNAFGEIRVSEINGKLDLSTTHKPLEVRDCTGQFTISTRYGECRLTNLAGDVHLDGRGQVYIENVKGDVHVTNEYSSLEIFGIDGKAFISSTEGNLWIKNVTKPVVIDARGTQLRINNIKDSLKITESHGNVEISDAASTVKLESRYSTLSLKDIRGKIEIDSNSDQISANDITGNIILRARASSIQLNRVTGGVDIQTTLKNVVANNIAGNCSITNEYADISLSARSLGKIMQIKNRNGGIFLFLPEPASFGIDATARNGQIAANYSGLGLAEHQGNAAVLKSKAKTGDPTIQLETEYGNININRFPEDGTNPFKVSDAQNTTAWDEPKMYELLGSPPNISRILEMNFRTIDAIHRMLFRAFQRFHMGVT